MSKDKRDTQTPDMFDEVLFISQMKDENTIHIPHDIKTQEQFLEWINGVFVPEEEYDENGLSYKDAIRGYN